MVPSVFLPMETWPLAATGKLDRKALPSPEQAVAKAVVEAPVLPRNELERTIAEIWKEVVGLAGGRRPRQLLRRRRPLAADGPRPCPAGGDPGLQGLHGRPLPASDRRRPRRPPGAPPRRPRPPPLRRSVERRSEDVAVIGMAGRFPGARDVEELWRNLRAGSSRSAPSPTRSCAPRGSGHALLATPAYVQARGALDGRGPLRRRLLRLRRRARPRSSTPSSACFLECAWEALEDAGYGAEAARRTGRRLRRARPRTPMCISLLRRPRDLVRSLGAQQLAIAQQRRLPAHPGLLQARPEGAERQRPDRLLDLAGRRPPGLPEPPRAASARWPWPAASRSSCPRSPATSTRRAGSPPRTATPAPSTPAPSGVVGGSGAGVVVLKRLEDALADGDTVHAVILGSAINNDGSAKVGLHGARASRARPRPSGEAHRAAGIEPGTIALRRGPRHGHGAGRPHRGRGPDPGLPRRHRRNGLLRPRLDQDEHRPPRRRRRGRPGLIKTVLALERPDHPAEPPLRAAPTREIDFEGSPFYVKPTAPGNGRRTAPPAGPGSAPSASAAPTPMRSWRRPRPVLGEPPPPARAPPDAVRQDPVGPRDRHRATDRSPGGPSRASLGGRRLHPPGRPPSRSSHRRMLVCRDREEAVPPLRDCRSPSSPARRSLPWPSSSRARAPSTWAWARSSTQTSPSSARPSTTAASSWASWVDLRDSCSAGRAAMTDSRRTLLSPSRPSSPSSTPWPGSGWPGESGRRRCSATAWASTSPPAWPASFRWRTPCALVAARGRLMQELPAGAMLGVSLPEDEVAGTGSKGPDLSLAAVNAPRRLRRLRPAEAIEALRAELEAQGVEPRRLHTSHAFHSADDGARSWSRFAERVRQVKLHAAAAYPTSPTSPAPGSRRSRPPIPSYWAQHLRQPVRFADGVADAARLSGSRSPGGGPGPRPSRPWPASTRTRRPPGSWPPPSAPQRPQAGLGNRPRCPRPALGDRSGGRLDRLPRRRAPPARPAARPIPSSAAATGSAGRLPWRSRSRVPVGEGPGPRNPIEETVAAAFPSSWARRGVASRRLLRPGRKLAHGGPARLAPAAGARRRAPRRLPARGLHRSRPWPS